MVSFDAAWEKCGWHSHIGITFVMEANTGLIVDQEALPTICTNVCAHKHMTLSLEAFEECKAKTSHECTYNHSGSAGTAESKTTIPVVASLEKS